ncbi:MAG: DEAD/DEAH box helicase [Beijerinckiaceae bacterium]|nr:DEAD/DEAH box helicase [Beijerinckiaceae bacterium]
MRSTSKFQSKILSRPSEASHYNIYCSALEWDLTDPIVIESADDFKSTKRWEERLTPFHHQISNLITFCRRLPVTLLADDVGLGKTISAGLVMSELIARARLSKVLIVCPKVLCPQWKEELASKFDIPSIIATGREILSANPGDVGAVITTYNSARLYLEKIPEDRFQMLVLDEAHKLRNLHGTPDTPQVARTFYKALSNRRFSFVLMLTATPIQNRLWDLYSLVDLLTAARGHDNPFGSPGMFARRFIADERDKARQLKPEARDEFRSIVYGYMSRVRRGDANLLFPERIVQMHNVLPTPAEIELITAIAEPIKEMNRLAQISILQALASSPHALAAQLINMARNGTVSKDLAIKVGQIVLAMPPSAKLSGLAVLIEQLKRQQPDSWRLIVFTTRRETQTTIQNFLESQGLKVGLINGDSGLRNQETISKFRETPPSYRVIVSTEAGSEGVNLQVANVLVNYDLPWNPMIVEQRIGRVQRLGSDHAHVSIFNITLKGTFEEYIVARLMEKLQMASHAIGDIESLLQGADVGDRDEDAGRSFEDQILELVLAALAGKDVEKDVRLKETSIENAKRELELEEAAINAMLGSMDSSGYTGPKAPALPKIQRSMEPPDFIQSAFQMLGAKISEFRPGIFAVEEKSSREYITFDPEKSADKRVGLYTPQSPAFQRLVKRSISSALHDIKDGDDNPGTESQSIASAWVEQLGAKFDIAKVTAAARSFHGDALLRVRATTAHDSYERLVSCKCENQDHQTYKSGPEFITPVADLIQDIGTLGIDPEKLRTAGESDMAIAEFSRFYLERGAIEVEAAGTDDRKRKKLEDDFTPRLEMTLVGVKGSVSRDVDVRVRYTFASGGEYESDLTIRPSTREIVKGPEIARCGKSGQQAPITCFGQCAYSGAQVLKHLLVSSEFSTRQALSEFTATCALSGKTAVKDELELSYVTGRLIASSLLMTSSISGKRGEPEHFSQCHFTNSTALKSEQAESQISEKYYRSDEQARSEFTGKLGHKSEFLACFETRQTIAANEAETCEITQKKVRPGILIGCDITGKRVLPSELSVCAASRKRVLKSLLVTSSVSQAPLIPEEALQSLGGAYCLPVEAEACFWSGRRSHPDDMRTCTLSGLPIHVEFATKSEPPRLRSLVEMLDGIRRSADEESLWPTLETRVAAALKGGKVRVEAAVISPAKQHLAVCSESKKLLGLKVRQVGVIYDIKDNSIIGRLAEGKRNAQGWVAE